MTARPLGRSSVRFGPFQLIRRLGAGGMGEVFLATMDEGGAGRAVALKRILPHLVNDARFLEMFHEEARLSARLHHPNIVELLRSGEVDGVPYLAMEYVDGMDLHRLVERLGGGPTDPGLAAWVVREVCSALAHAHRLTDEEGRPLGIVHRDLNPGNILVALDGAVKLADFGVAKAMAAAEVRTRTQTGVRKGTRQYAAPEQLQGRAVDHRADLFALGTILHGLVNDPNGARQDPEPIERCEAVWSRAMSPKPEERYQSADEMLRALDVFVLERGWTRERFAKVLEPLGSAAGRTYALPVEPTLTQPRVPGQTTRARGWYLGGIGAALLLASLSLAVARWNRAATPDVAPVQTPAPIAAPVAPARPQEASRPLVEEPRTRPATPERPKKRVLPHPQRRRSSPQPAPQGEPPDPFAP